MENKKVLFLCVILIIFIFGVGLYVFKLQKQNNNIVIPELKIEQSNKTEKLNADYLLVQIDKHHCLSADYTPSDLVSISNYNISTENNFKLRKVVINDLVAMVASAKKDGIDLKVISAYRTYQDQKRTYNSWVSQLGEKEAGRQSAPAGCSQHELGTAVDFNELSISFSNTPAGIWLSKNAWQYGWVISYPINSENVTGYIYEPWHYRYIGIKNAEELKKSGLILSDFLNIKK